MAPAPSARKRVLVVIGTRPEGIKLAPVVDALRRRADVIETRVALTGQHTDLMDQVLDVFGLHPDWDLGIMREGQDLYDVTQACLDALRRVVSEWRPGLMLVEGDTATVFVGGLVGFFERIAVAHVEAGLRSGDKWRPYPEEIFRRLTGVIADLHFAPTPRAQENLCNEGVPKDRIFVTGNTVVDALLSVAARLPTEPTNTELKTALRSGRRLVLLTAHRRESFGEPMRRAFEAVRELADRFSDIEILYPVHPNPNVLAAAEALRGHSRIRLTEPLDYRDLVRALKSSVLVLTDSGGIQEEAPTFGVPVLVMREVTERPEAVEADDAALVGTDKNAILGLACAILEGGGAPTLVEFRRLRDAGLTVAAAIEGVVARGLWRRKTVFGAIEDAIEGASEESLALPTGMGAGERHRRNPYGDGLASERIADIIAHRLTGSPRATVDWHPAHAAPAPDSMPV
jgi:UDP-N-acetylglucosamine 2-epimerase (non-hydrolysing)